MALKRFGALACAVLLALALAAQAAAQPPRVRGRATDEQGRPVAGLLVSDEYNVAVSDAAGVFDLPTESGRVVSFCAPDGLALDGPWWQKSADAAAGERRVFLRANGFSPPLRLALVSDLHLFDYQVQFHYYNLDEKAAALPMRAWESVAMQVGAYKPHLTLILGDLCADADKGDAERTAMQMKLAADAAAMLPGPWRAIPGNHDVRYDGDKVSYQAWRDQMGPMRHVYIVGGMALVMLDNVAVGHKKNGKAKNCGAMSKASLAWLQRVLAALPPQMPVILATHFPLASALAGANPLHGGSLVDSTKKPGFALRDVDQNAAAALELLMARQAAAVLLSGHEHAYHHGWLETRQGPVQLVAAPAVCGGWWADGRPWGPVAFDQGWLEATITMGPRGPVVQGRLRVLDPQVNVLEK